MSDIQSQIKERIAFIGFGEAAQAFTKGWQAQTEMNITAFDIKTDNPETRGPKLNDYRGLNVSASMSAADAVHEADLIFSAVTASEIINAANSVLPALKSGQLYLDINSAASSRKRQAAKLIHSQDAEYVDVAVMAPVHPKLHQTPLLIGGPGAKRAGTIFEQLGMKFQIVSEDVGDASTIKMVRSVMIKGLSGLTIECFLAAVAEGVETHILESLSHSLPGIDWETFSGQMFERVITHGKRQAAEMCDVTMTLNDIGVGGIMAAATAERLQQLANMQIADDFPGDIPENYQQLANIILKHMRDGNEPDQVP